jgi:predicted SAM-dependent methyltransferase
MKLHLGCGSIYLPGWVNVDLDSPQADMNLDLCERLPFEDESVESIYSEHFIEHIGRDDARRLLLECRRVLRPGGVIRISTPDLKFLALTYLAKNITEWGDMWSPSSPCLLMNEGMRSWGHQFLYDADEMELLFFEVGFGHRRFQGWQQSDYPVFSGLETRPFHQDLIIEACRLKAGQVAEPLRAVDMAPNEWQAKIKQSAGEYVRQLERQVQQQAEELRRLRAEQGRAEKVQSASALRRLFGGINRKP